MRLGPRKAIVHPGPEIFRAGNLITSPFAMENASWNVNGNMSATSANAVIAPDGTTTADKIIPNATLGDHFISQSAMTTTAAVHKAAVRCAPAGYNFVELLMGSTLTYTKFIGVYVDLTTGQYISHRVTTYQPISISVKKIANGFTRIEFTFLADANSTHRLNIRPNVSATSNLTNFSGDTVAGIYAWGAELVLI